MESCVTFTAQRKPLTVILPLAILGRTKEKGKKEKERKRINFNHFPWFETKLETNKISKSIFGC